MKCTKDNTLSMQATKKNTTELPVFGIDNFHDYNHCQHFDNNFYIRVFDEHLKDNTFINIPHGHDFYIVLLITKGTGTHTIDFVNYDVNPGSMFVLSPGQIHKWDLSQDTNGYILFFSKPFFSLHFNLHFLEDLPYLHTGFSQMALSLEKENIDHLYKIYERIDIEYQSKQPYFHDIIRFEISILLTELKRLYNKQRTTIKNAYYFQQINKFENLIDEHYKKHYTVAELASLMNLSTRQLNLLCKKTLNKKPIELLHDRIILESKRLLIHTDWSVSAIAAHLNYFDYSYFIRFFKKHTDTTPEQFRQQFHAL